jgi:hypothetical protein
LRIYPHNPTDQKLKTDVRGVVVDRAFLAHIQTAVAAASATGVHAAIVCSTAVTTVTTGFTSPAVPRNITATAGGTATDIKAVQVVVTGTNYAGQIMTETLPVFTVDTVGTVVGSKAFKTITGVTIPAMDGAGATVSIGWGSKLGLPYKLDHNTVDSAFLNKVKEGTAPTVAVSATVLESNTVTLSSALDGSVVDIYLKV